MSRMSRQIRMFKRNRGVGSVRWERNRVRFARRLKSMRNVKLPNGTYAWGRTLIRNGGKP